MEENLIDNYSTLTYATIRPHELKAHPYYKDMNIVREIELLQKARCIKTSLTFEDELKVIFKFIDPIKFFNDMFTYVYKFDGISTLRYQIVDKQIKLFVVVDIKDKAKWNKYKLKEPLRYQRFVNNFMTKNLVLRDNPIPLFKGYHEG